VDISCGQLELFLDEYDTVPYRVIQFLTSYINYGGRVTDAIDLRTIDVIMNMFCCPGLLDGTYQFDRDGVYKSIDVDQPRASPEPTGDKEQDAATAAKFEEESESWGPRAACELVSQ
jgi:hypothetical protein